MISYEDQRPGAPLNTDTSPPMRVGGRYQSASYQRVKRLTDVVVGSLGLVILFPLFCLISLLIFASGGRPIVFRQKRIGKDGREFHIYKFRTMVKNAEEILRNRPELMEEYRKYYKITNDPRISRIGRILRKTSLDELPQLFNVIKGDMSLVGPRPIVPDEIKMYGEAADVYLMMKPGCAGLWQCSGRSSTTYEERVALDEEYFERAGLRYDLKILGLTAVSILRANDAM
jgi:exopolysaccharide production protein ExoY